MIWLEFLLVLPKVLDTLILLARVEFFELVFANSIFLFPLIFLVGSFSALEMIERVCFLSLSLRFFNLEIFYRAALVFSSSGVSWPDKTKTILIFFTSSRKRLEYCFSYNVNHFLYCILEVVQFAVALLYFSPDRRF